jgi:prepilin-type processing-associated H-X9-DG protein
LVVIAVIALLMAILLPALQRVRKQARAVVCQTNLKQWGSTLALYAEDSEGRLSGDSNSTLWILSGRYVGLANPDEPKRFHPIMTDGIALCPMAARRPEGTGTFSSTRTTGSRTYRVEGVLGTTFASWDITSFSPPFRCSYGLNHALFPSRPYYREGSVSHGHYYPYLYSIRRNSSIPVLLDSVKSAGAPRDDRRPPRHDKDAINWPFCINRHDGSVNGLFLDWSVRKVGLKELWTLKWSPGFDTAGPWTRAGGVQPEDWPEWMRNFKDY